MSEEQPRPESDVLADRRAKLERLQDAGVDPFPHDFDGRVEVAGVRSEHEGLGDGEETDARVRIAGRLAARRGHGKAAFLDLRDGSGEIQLHARLDVLGQESLDGLVGLDLGDIVGVEGAMFRSKRGELSVRVEDWTLLAKTLRPLPDRHSGLADTETRLRRRELDLIANPEVRERFVARSRTVASIRRRLDADGFVEVETPVLQPLYGGALARPFTTHHNVLDRDLYLRIATELYLKRCVVGGIERVYELGKSFRNEGISPKHNPEFTIVEWYEAYADYEDAAARLEALVAAVATDVLGEPAIEHGGERIDLSGPWQRTTLRQAIADHAGIDIAEHGELDSLAAAAGIEPAPGEGWGKLVDRIFSERVEPAIAAPTFVMDYPVEISPLAKRHRTEEGLVERWEAFVGGVEIANAFTELNDPDEQRRRFEQQRGETARGDEEAQPFDEDFVRALEHGMPPTAGVGLGIDRLVMLLTGAPSVREVILFPALRM